MEARAVLAQYYGVPKRHKYKAERTQVDGIWFASKREAERYRELLVLVRIGELKELELQPRYELHSINLETGELAHVATYIADFRYRVTKTDESVTEDSKGFRTPAYRLKKKLVEAEYGITIREV